MEEKVIDLKDLDLETFVPKGEDEEKFKRKGPWFNDPDFIKEISYPHKLYFEELRRQIQKFIYGRPVSARVKWDHRTDKHVTFYVGKNSMRFALDHNMSVYDWTHMVEREFLKNFYPYYKVEKVTTRKPEVSEIQEFMKNGMSIYEAKEEKIETKEVEVGVIDQVTLRDDKFRIDVNGQKSIRISGSRRNGFNLMLLSEFMHKVRRIQAEGSHEELRDFIFDNSEEEHIFDVGPRYIGIDYTNPLMMLNFFKERVHDLWKEEIRYDDESGQFVWGRFRIYIEDHNLQDECFNIVKDYRAKMVRSV